jgi:hypothetical protein
MMTKKEVRSFYEENHRKEKWNLPTLKVFDSETGFNRYLKPFAIIRVGEQLKPVFSCLDSGIKFISRITLARIIRKNVLPSAHGDFYNLIDSLALLYQSKDIDPPGIGEFIKVFRRLYFLGHGIRLVYGADPRDRKNNIMLEIAIIHGATGLNYSDVFKILEESHGPVEIKCAFRSYQTIFDPIDSKECIDSAGKVGELLTLGEYGSLVGGKLTAAISNQR